jgi:hypothetical protein
LSSDKLNKHRDPRVERMTNIDEETQGVLDTTLNENEEDGGFTLVKVERMVDL